MNILQHLDREAVGMSGGIDIDSAGFQGGSGFFRVFTPLQATLPTEITGSGSESKSFIKTGEKYFPLQFPDDFCRVSAWSAMNEKRSFIVG